MIFVTVGSQKFPFDRLIRQLDEMAAAGIFKQDVMAQIGTSTYLPKHIRYERFIDREQFASCIDQCNLLITHGGEGAIMTGLLNKKKVIAVVRYAKYGEHVNDHQLQIVKALESQGYIIAAYDSDSLQKQIEQAATMQLKSYDSGNNDIIQSICRFIEWETGGCI